MFTKINILPIVSTHFNSFRDYRTGRFVKSALVGFYIVPFVVAIVLDLFHFTMPAFAATGAVTILNMAFLMCMLFVTVFLLCRQNGQAIDGSISDRVIRNKKILMKQLIANIFYGLFVSVFLFVALNIFLAQPIIMLIAVAIGLHLFLVSLMIATRLFSLMVAISDVCSVF